MKLKRLNEGFLKQFENYDFSLIQEEKIGLVGSVRYKDYFIKIESILQILYKKIVSICSVDGLLNKREFSEDEWEALQVICIKKLKDQDALLVIDKDGYVGDHTTEEIEYFIRTFQKKIYYLSKISK
ncbi:MAG: hypothetical protein ACTSR8_17615 [Promethearchaeota archaeon]